MFPEKKIEFSIHKDLINIENIKPIETKKVLPNWYKNINKHTLNFRNLKGCIPFLDNLSAGYVLPLPQDFHIAHCKTNVNTGEKESSYIFALSEGLNESECSEYNINGPTQDVHPIDQIGGEGSFLGKKNGNNNVIKIINPWLIKTPPGYSCLFTSPAYNENDYFSIISAIVDTDTFDNYINFPIIINHDKYPSFEKTFEQGLPYVQIIPFKRDSWRKKITTTKKIYSNFKYFSKIIHRYKQLIWSRKTWR
jgi:hypothetical protein